MPKYNLETRNEATFKSHRRLSHLKVLGDSPSLKNKFCYQIGNKRINHDHKLLVVMVVGPEEA